MMLKQKFKKLTLYAMVAVTLCVGFLGNLVVIRAAETEETVNITEWKQIREYRYLPVKCRVGNVDISYTYNENNYRTSKTVDEAVTTYAYEEYIDDDTYMKRYRLVSETYNDEQIEYMYDEVDMGKVIGFTYGGNTYSYQYNDYGSIIGIIYDGELIGTYNYDDDYVSTINYDLSENNIMSVNPLRYEGYYLDGETGYYYVNGSYNDLKNGQVVNKNLLEDLPMNAKSRATLTPLEQFKYDVYYHVSLNSGIGVPIRDELYMENGAWTSGMSIIEILARTIYGEYNGEAYLSTTSVTQAQMYWQRTAVAWIIRNRMTYSGAFANTLAGVVKEHEQFAALTGDLICTSNARKPNTEHSAWDEAVLLASILYCSTYISYGSYSGDEVMASLTEKRDGLNKQKYFVSLGTWELCYDANTKTFQFDKGIRRYVKDIAINVGELPSGVPRNIFFDFK